MSRKRGSRLFVRSMRWRLRRLGVTQAGTACPGARRISGSTGPRADAGCVPATAAESSPPISSALLIGRFGVAKRSFTRILAFRTKLEGLVERHGLAAELAGDGALLGVGGYEGVRLALLGALVDVQHRVVDHLVDHRTDDQGLLSAIACGPNAALLSGRCRSGLDQRLGGAGGRGDLELRLVRR